MKPEIDRSVMHGLPEWLEDSVIPIPMIEEFKKQLGDADPQHHHH